MDRKKNTEIVKQVPVETAFSKEEVDDDYEDEGSHSSSSETLTCSASEVQETSNFSFSALPELVELLLTS